MEQQAPPAVEWLQGAPGQANLAPFLGDMAGLGEKVLREYKIDCDSAKDWRERCDLAVEMATMVRKEKSYPWPKASNIKFPLIVQAAIEFNAQAYPALVPPGDVVKVAVNGKDPAGQKAARAARVAAHMSHQLRKRVKGWEDDTDRLLMMLPVCGTMHRKLWPDGMGGICQKLTRPGSVILNDASASLEAAPRVSERFSLYPHEIIERQRDGRFVEGEWWKLTDDDKADSIAPRWFVEQHRREDLDGDGYPEPYIVTVAEMAETVVRVVANWRPEDIALGPAGVQSIKASCYYADYHFMPSPGGGYYSMGFGSLLGDLGETINSTINMMMDASHKEMMGAGFIGSEARLRGGPMILAPGEYRQVEARGGDLRAAIVNAPGTGASPVMFNLLGLLLDAARSLANTKDIQDLSGRSNQPATTTLALIEQGMQVYGAIFKRVHRGMAREFGMIARFNSEGLDPQEYAQFHDAPADPRADYAMGDDDIEPIADPRAVTSPQRMAQAAMLREMGAMGEIDRGAATMRVLEAAGIPDREELMPKPDPAAAAMADAQARAAMLMNVETGLRIAEIEARIAKLDAEAMKTLVEAEVADPTSPLAMARTQLDALKASINDGSGDAGRVAQPSRDGAGVGGAGGGSGAQETGALAGLLGAGAEQPGVMGGFGPMGASSGMV